MWLLRLTQYIVDQGAVKPTPPSFLDVAGTPRSWSSCSSTPSKPRGQGIKNCRGAPSIPYISLIRRYGLAFISCFVPEIFFLLEILVHRRPLFSQRQRQPVAKLSLGATSYATAS